jgi:hypothetical protein
MSISVPKIRSIGEHAVVTDADFSALLYHAHGRVHGAVGADMKLTFLVFENKMSAMESAIWADPTNEAVAHQSKSHVPRPGPRHNFQQVIIANDLDVTAVKKRVVIVEDISLPPDLTTASRDNEFSPRA